MKINCQGKSALCEMTTIYGRSAKAGVYALAETANALRAQGGEEIRVDVRIDMPEYMFKSRLHQLQKDLKETCKEKGIALHHVYSTKHSGVALMAVTVTGMAVCGELKSEGTSEDGKRLMSEGMTESGKELVLLGWPGMEGMLRIADEREKELKERFASTFFHQIRSYEKYLFADEMLRAVSGEAGENPEITQIGEGGIFAALWDLAKVKNCGLDVDLKKIRLLQETVEVCELFRLNPYQLASAGAFVCITGDGEALAEKLRGEGYPAWAIGRLTDDNDKILRNGEEIRYIDRPVPDEIFKIYEEQDSANVDRERSLC